MRHFVHSRLDLSDSVAKRVAFAASEGGRDAAWATDARYVASNRVIRIRFRADKAMSAHCWIFQRPQTRARRSPPYCFSQPKTSSSSFRFRWLTW